MTIPKEYIKRNSSTIPFGYELEKESDTFLKPIPDQLIALSVATFMIKDEQVSLRDAADWLYQKTGRYISHVGLKNIVDKEKYDK